MKKLLLICALFASQSFAGGSSNVSYVANQGNKQDSDTPAKTIPNGALGNTITLIGGAASVGANSFFRLVKMGSGTNGANYQVTAGKTLYCSGVWLYTLGLETFSLGYGTAAVTENNSTTPAGQVVFGGSAATRVLTMPTGSVQGAYKFFPIPMSFPAASFPYIQARDSLEFSAIFLCEEQ